MYDFCHVFGAHAYDRCIIVAEFFLLCRSISTVCSFCCWVRHYDRKNLRIRWSILCTPLRVIHRKATPVCGSQKNTNIRVLYSALSLCTISCRIVQVPDCRGAVESRLAVLVTVYRTTRIILIGHGLWELLIKVI